MASSFWGGTRPISPAVEEGCFQLSPGSPQSGITGLSRLPTGSPHMAGQHRQFLLLSVTEGSESWTAKSAKLGSYQATPMLGQSFSSDRSWLIGGAPQGAQSPEPRLNYICSDQNVCAMWLKRKSLVNKEVTHLSSTQTKGQRRDETPHLEKRLALFSKFFVSFSAELPQRANIPLQSLFRLETFTRLWCHTRKNKTLNEIQ